MEKIIEQVEAVLQPFEDTTGIFRLIKRNQSLVEFLSGEDLKKEANIVEEYKIFVPCRFYVDLSSHQLRLLYY